MLHDQGHLKEESLQLYHLGCPQKSHYDHVTVKGIGRHFIEVDIVMRVRGLPGSLPEEGGSADDFI
jgi:hypothetical protein